MQGSTPGGIRVRGRELIQSLISGSTTLLFGANGTTTSASIGLNPLVFPRLSAYAPIYEEYFFHDAIVEFQSNQPTTSTGVSIISVDYDNNDANPASTVAMMRNITASMSNVYANNACEIKGSLSRLKRYYAASSGANGIDTNQAAIYYAFEGVVPTSSSMGYICVEYDVEFFTPQ